MIRRLTAGQFTATLRDLFFGDPTVPAITVFSDPSVLGFTSDANALLVQGLNAQQLADHAEGVAHWAVTRHLSRYAPCANNGSGDAACRQQFVRAFGRRAFREPLSEERAKVYDGLFAAEANFADGAEVVIAAMLQSPYFLYRRELGGATTGDVVSLTPHEVASGLSYLLTGSMPDDQLLAAADSGQLTTRPQIEQQAMRLLQTPRAADAVMEFFSGWLALDRLERVVKDDNVFKLSTGLKAAMAGETRAYLLDAFSRNAPVAELFASEHSFLNQELAQFYGVYPRDGTQLGATFSRVTYAAGIRRDPGLLGHGGILTGNADAAISSPVLRGKLVRTRLLCQDLPPPPADVDTKLKPAGAAKTTREHFAAHAQNPTCAACHRLMDPIGYAFEHYDAFGRWRDQENGVPIDARGTIHDAKAGATAAGSSDVNINGLKELAAFLASSTEAKDCLVRYWAYHAYGLSAWSQDGCTFDAIRMNAAGYGLRDVLLALIRAPHFTQRLRGGL